MASRLFQATTEQPIFLGLIGCERSSNPLSVVLTTRTDRLRWSRTLTSRLLRLSESQAFITKVDHDL